MKLVKMIGQALSMSLTSSIVSETGAQLKSLFPTLAGKVIHLPMNKILPNAIQLGILTSKAVTNVFDKDVYIPGTYPIKFRGIPGLITIKLSDKEDTDYNTSDNMQIEITLFSFDKSIMGEFVKAMSMIHKVGSHEVLTFSTGPSGGWRYKKVTGYRPFDTLFFENNLVEELIEDLERVKSTGTLKRGYLFHGPPGTGKSSLAHAIASYLEVENIFVVTAFPKDASRLFERDLDGMLIFEDLDESLSRDSVSLSTLYNHMDGFLSQENCVTIITTNNPDLLPKTLLRPGRIDKAFYVPMLTKDTAIKLVQSMQPSFAYEDILSYLDNQAFTASSLSSSARIAESFEDFVRSHDAYLQNDDLEFNQE